MDNEVKSNIKKIFVSLGIIISCGIVVYLSDRSIKFCEYIMNDKQIAISDKYSILGNLSQILTFIIAIINLIAIIYFFYRENRSKIEENKILSKAHWFNDFIYEKNINKIDEYFIEIKNNAIEILQTEGQEKRNKIWSLNQIFPEFMSEMITLISIMGDEKIKGDIEECLTEFQDKLIECIIERENSDENDAKEVIREKKIEFVGILYKYNMSIYDQKK